MAQSTSLNVLIVGAGIGGLTTAAALCAHGHTVTVVEKRPALFAAGAGIMLQPNATAVLEELGLGDAIFAAGATLEAFQLATDKGTVLQQMGVGPLVESYPPIVGLSRASLHDILSAAAKDATFRFDDTVTALSDQGSHVDVTFASGQSCAFDYVVGADGIGSVVRALIAPDEGRVVYSGYTCWRALVKNPNPHEPGRELWGPGKRVGLVPLGDGMVYTFLVANAPEGTPRQPTEISALQKRFAGFGKVTDDVLALLTADNVMHHDIAEHSAQAYGTGRIALLGDAAHALTPNMGQGAAMAIEDAHVLAEVLATHAPAEATAAYALARRARVQTVVDRSRQLGRVAQWENGLARAVRNTLMRVVPAGMAERQTAVLWDSTPAKQGLLDVRALRSADATQRAIRAIEGRAG